MIDKHWAHRLLIAFAVVILAGCATLESGLQLAVKKPTVEVSQVRITNFGLQQVSLQFELDISNPNGFDIKSQGFDYQMGVEQRLILTVSKTAQPIDLPANGTGRVSLPVTLRFIDLYQAVAGLRDKNEFQYQLDAGFYFDLPILGDVRVPVGWQDTVPIPRLPKVELTEANLVGLSLTGADVNLTLTLQNFNAFDLNLNHFDYRVSANGWSIADGQVKNLHIAKNQNTKITLPLSLDFTELGLAIYQILASSKSVRIGLNGQLDLVPDIPLWRPGPIEFDVSGQLIH